MVEDGARGYPERSGASVAGHDQSAEAVMPSPAPQLASQAESAASSQGPTDVDGSAEFPHPLPQPVSAAVLTDAIATRRFVTAGRLMVGRADRVDDALPPFMLARWVGHHARSQPFRYPVVYAYIVLPTYWFSIIHRCAQRRSHISLTGGTATARHTASSAMRSVTGG